MSEPLFWVTVAAVLTVVQWVPYIAERALLWGPATFLNNYPEGFPATEPEPAAWAIRAKRAHLNMVETFPSFAAVVVIGEMTTPLATAGVAAQVFVLTRLLYAAVYIGGVPFLRTPVYLASWAVILYLGLGLLTA